MMDLIPGENYSVTGKHLMHSSGPKTYDDVMYVRDEVVEGRKWHVFAHADRLLIRVRVDAKTLKVGIEKRLSADYMVTRAICMPRSEQMRCVRSFIKETRDLVEARADVCPDDSMVNVLSQYLH